MFRIEHVLISDGVAAKLARKPPTSSLGGKYHLTDVEVREALTAGAYPRVVRRFKGKTLYQVYGRAVNGRYIFCLVRNLGWGGVRVITTRQMEEKQKRYYQSPIRSL